MFWHGRVVTSTNADRALKNENEICRSCDEYNYNDDINYENATMKIIIINKIVKIMTIMTKIRMIDMMTMMTIKTTLTKTTMMMKTMMMMTIMRVMTTLCR